MKWFFALDQNSNHLDSYVEMTKVAVHTARTRTTLEAHCLFDGDAGHEFAVWLRNKGVTVHLLRTPFFDELKTLASQKNDPDILSFGAGAFLRLEIPKLIAREGWDDEFVLYTDCDVMFTRDPVPAISKVRPSYFAVAPEAHIERKDDINTGVMLLNVQTMRRIDADLHGYTRRHLAMFTDYRAGNAFDQAAFQSYFRGLTRFLIERGARFPIPRNPGFRLVWGRFFIRASFVNRPQWDRLAPEFNWKSYWDDARNESVIVHFHGPKPNEARIETSPQSLNRSNPILEQVLSDLRTPAFYANCEKWANVLSEVD